MAIAVRERTGELAVLKAVGYSDRFVLGLVLAESGLIAAVGGAIGLWLSRGMVAQDITGELLPMYLSGSAIAAGALVAGMVALGTRRCGRIGLLGLTWLLAFLLPALLVPSSSEILAAERYLYLPSIGVFLALGHAAGTGIDALSPAPRPLPWRALACVAAALGTGALVRSTVWRNDLTLSTDLARTAPNTALAHSALGQALLAAERYPEALASFGRAMELSPNDAGAHNDLGIALRRLRQPGLAAAAFRQSLRLDPTRSGPRLNLAYACLMLRDFGCVTEQHWPVERGCARPALYARPRTRASRDLSVAVANAS